MDVNPEIAEKLKNCELPPFPKLTQKVVELTRDFYADPNDIAELVKMDMTLSASVLKVANSVAYGYAGKVSSVSEAISRVGLVQMRDMVLSVSLVNEFKSINGIDFGQFWNHCLTVANAAEVVSKHADVRIKDAENLYTAGLLHKAGILLLAQNFPEKYQEVLDGIKSEDQDLWELEKNLIGITHNQASDLVFDDWKFPRDVSDVALYYNDPVQAPEDTKELIFVVHIANFICLNQGIGVGIDQFPMSFYDAAWETIGLHTADIPELIEEVKLSTAKAKSIIDSTS